MQNRQNGKVSIPVGKVVLQGELIIPFFAKSIVIFSHGSGSSHLSPRNKMVAAQLHQNDIGTLLFDLLTPQEDCDRENRFNIELLTQRLIATTKWLEGLKVADGCTFGYFGASTGAASALKAAAYLPQIRALVSRGGRPDLAMNILNKVEAPTLLIVGSLDKEVLKLNQEAYAQLQCEKKLSVIEGATHLFEEGNTMIQVGEEALLWFRKHLQPSSLAKLLKNKD